MGKKKTEETAPAPVATNKPEDEEELPDTPAVKALKEIDLRYCAIESEYEIEVHKLRKRYFEEKQKVLLEERATLLADTANAPADDHMSGTPACKGFWLQAFQNAEDFAEVLQDWDEPVLEYLQDVKQVVLDDVWGNDKAFRLDFTFKENPYFTNTTLSAEFHTDIETKDYKPWMESKCVEVKSTVIDWKAGKNITVEVVAKKAKGGGAKKAKQKAKGGKEEPRPSFFRAVFRNMKMGDDPPEDLLVIMGEEMEGADDEDKEGMVEYFLENLHGVGHCIAEEVVPYAVRFYTGEAGGDDDDEDDEESEEEDDDDDDEDDSEDEPAPKGGAKKKAGKGAPAPGKKEEECKQQ